MNHQFQVNTEVIGSVAYISLPDLIALFEDPSLMSGTYAPIFLVVAEKLKEIENNAHNPNEGEPYETTQAE